jgi:hypothetical protein
LCRLFARRGVTVLVVTCSFFLVGCSSQSGPATIRGKVVFEGQSFRNWMIHIVPKNPGVGTSAILERDGSFTLPSRVDPDETYIAFFTAIQSSVPLSEEQQLPPDPPIPAKYHSLKTTDLTCEIKAGQNWVTFELKK